MRLAVISDIHGNLEAFRQVLADIDRSQIDNIVCLGDCIGYGPEPEEVVGLVRELDIPCVLGNHELGLLDRTYLDWFNPPTRDCLLHTETFLSKATMDYLGSFPPALVRHGSRCVHGYPPDSVTTYLFQVAARELARSLKATAEAVCFVGHTHDLAIIGLGSEGLLRLPLGPGVTPLVGAPRWIINVGSVGQPRDGNNKAKYVIWDPEEATVEVRFVAYEIAHTVAKMKERGFPEWCGRRLW
jgi:predicted phosphodiesterase